MCECVCARERHIRDEGNQITVFLSPHGSDSCAAAVCASVRKCVSGERGGGGLLFVSVCECVSDSER